MTFATDFIFKRAFIGRLCLLMLLLSGILLPASAQHNTVPVSRINRMTRGNSTIWMGAAHGKRTIQPLSRVLSDISSYKAKGFKMVRIPCHGDHTISDRTTGALNMTSMAALKDMVDACTNAGLAVLLNPQQFGYPASRAIQLQYLKNFVNYFKTTNPEWVFFELQNEPCCNADEWDAVQQQWTPQIRNIVPNHTLFLTASLKTAGGQWDHAGALIDITVVPDGNVVYTWHPYDPFEFTHQGMSGRPPANSNYWPDAGKGWNFEYLRNNIKRVYEWGLRNNVVVHAGEFGCQDWASPNPSEEYYWHDMRILLESLYIPWVSWWVPDTQLGWDYMDMFRPTFIPTPGNFTSVNDATTGTGNLQFEFSGNWTTATGGAKFGGNERTSNTAGNYYQMRFNAKGAVRIYASLDPGYGEAAVSIDGGPEQTVSFNYPYREENVMVWNSPLLAAGDHIIKVRVASGKIPADRIDVVYDNGTAPPADTQAPTTPTNLTVSSKNSNSVVLNWTASTDNSGVLSYDIYQTGVASPIGSSGIATFTVAGLMANTSYSFMVKARDLAGNTSASSNTVTVTTDPAPREARIENGGTANYTDAQGKVWNADYGFTGGTTGDRGTSYEIYGTDDDRLYQTERYGMSAYAIPIANGTYNVKLHFAETYFTQAGKRVFSVTVEGTNPASLTNIDLYAQAGGKDTILVKILNNVTISDQVLNLGFSATVNYAKINAIEVTPADAVAPTAPTALTSPAKTDQSVSLSWTAATDNIGVTGYNVFVNGSTIPANANLIQGTTYTVAGLSPGTAYSFVVKAVDASNNVSAPSNTLSVTTSGDSQTPSVPTGLVSTGKSTTTVDLSWTASTDNIGVAGYEVYQGTTLVNTGGLITSTSYQVTGLTPNTAYSFTVKAKDAAGNTSAASAALNVTTNAATPAISVSKTLSPITVNGSLSETVWTTPTAVNNLTTGANNNTVTYGALWDNTHLYIGVRVLDANLFNDSGNDWEDDAVEVFIDGNNNGGSYEIALDRQYIKGFNTMGLYEKNNQTTGVQHASASISGGYTIEIAIPWSNIGISSPAAGLTIGFDVSNDDDDNGGTREGQKTWAATSNVNFQHTSSFGDLTLSATTVGTSPTTTLSLNPTADAHVRGGGAYQNTNYGSLTTVDIKNSPLDEYTREGYFKFSYPTFTSVTNAKLRIYARNSEGSQAVDLNVYGVNTDSWTETGINWSNKPAPSTAAMGPITINNVQQYYEVDVTSYVQAQLAVDKVVTFALINDSQQDKNIAINSKENAANKPELRITGSTTASSRMGENEVQRVVAVYPNPTTGKLTVSYDSPADQEVSIGFSDMMAQTALKSILPVKKGKNLLTLQVGHLSQGLYLLKLTPRIGTEAVQKVMVVR